MAYAEMYGPIQSALNSLNRQININADRDSRREAQGLQRLMTEERLLQGRFGRDMAEAAEARAERQLEMEEQSLSFNQRMRRDQEARAKAQWDLQKPTMEAAAARAEYEMRPFDMNMYSYVPNTVSANKLLFNNPEFIGMAERMAGGTFNPADGTFRDEQGQPVQITQQMEDAMLPQMQGLISSYVDPIRNAQYVDKELDRELKALKEQRKKFTGPMESRFRNQRIAVDQRIKALEEQQQSLSDNLTAENLLPIYKDKQTMLEQLAARADDPTLAQTFRAAAQDAGATVRMLLKDQLGLTKAKAKGAIPLVQKDWDVIYKQIKSNFGEEIKDEWIWQRGGQKMREHANKLAASLINKGDVPPQDVVNVATETARMAWQMYWDRVNTTAEIMGVDVTNTRDMEAFMRTTDMKKLNAITKEATGYVPNLTENPAIK